MDQIMVQLHAVLFLNRVKEYKIVDLKKLRVIYVILYNYIV